MTAPPVILASGSAIRAAMLRAAGVAAEVLPPGVDEDAVKQGLRAENAPPRDVADALAELKARRVSARRPDALTIGADQTLEKDGALFDKVETTAAAADALRRLAGGRHRLWSAIAVARDGVVEWRHVARVDLVMRPLSDAFIADYLAAEGDAALASVGCYRLEGRGAQLFTAIEGDYFTVLGLPLLPLLDYLRQRGALPS